MVQHCFGRLTPAEKTYIPDEERYKIYRNARIYIRFTPQSSLGRLPRTVFFR